VEAIGATCTVTRVSISCGCERNRNNKFNVRAVPNVCPVFPKMHIVLILSFGYLLSSIMLVPNGLPYFVDMNI
jgi:hypothetical protein